MDSLLRSRRQSVESDHGASEDDIDQRRELRTFFEIAPPLLGTPSNELR
jgi:hypothetical protein